jgi:hypothetical protein
VIELAIEVGKEKERKFEKRGAYGIFIGPFAIRIIVDPISVGSPIDMIEIVNSFIKIEIQNIMVQKCGRQVGIITGCVGFNRIEFILLPVEVNKDTYK